MYDIIIIGAGCAGLTAALYAARAGKSVLVTEGGAVGGQIASAPVIENFPLQTAISGAEFADGLFEQAAAQGVDFELETVTGLEDGKIKRVYTEDEAYEAKAVIIASGAKHRRLGADGEDRFAGAGVSYCAVCDGAFFKDKTAAVVGGGNSALASAIYLTGLCRRVYLIHRRASFRASDADIKRLTDTGRAEIITEATVERLEGHDSLEAVVLSDGRRIAADALFVSIGQEPDTERFRGVVEVNEDGYIKAKEDCKTNADGIFAAGDCREKRVRQLVTAAADGAAAAIGACEYIAANF